MEINARCLKIALTKCITEFTYLLNVCSYKCLFPTSWKIAIVVPIPKQGNTKNIDNLRPDKDGGNLVELPFVPRGQSML